MATTIKRLLLKGEQFVPITLAEAVVVNISDIAALQGTGVTTLDKVLTLVLGIVGSDKETLQLSIDTINETLKSKLDKLTAGNGITISTTEDNKTVISLDTSAFHSFLYKILGSGVELPDPSADCENIIYLKPVSDTNGNQFSEHICVKNGDNYVWELLGVLQSDVNLDDYVKTTDFNTLKTRVTTLESTTLTAENVTYKNASGAQLDKTVTWDIPTDLYDEALNS